MMFNKRNKKRGFTLIELIIVIAIIAILAAIAVPAFGQIRQKANVSTDMGNARTIYSVVAAEVADESILLPTGENFTYYALNSVGRETKEGNTVVHPPVSVVSKLGQTTTVKAYQGYSFFVGLNKNGDIQIVAAETLADAQASTADKAYNVYPAASGRYSK